jgi:hypothetical protein
LKFVYLKFNFLCLISLFSTYATVYNSSIKDPGSNSESMFLGEDHGSKTNGLPLKNWGCLAVGAGESKGRRGTVLARKPEKEHQGKRVLLQ